MEALMAVEPMTGQFSSSGDVDVNVGNKIRIESSGKRPHYHPA